MLKVWRSYQLLHLYELPLPWHCWCQIFSSKDVWGRARTCNNCPPGNCWPKLFRDNSGKTGISCFWRRLSQSLVDICAYTCSLISAFIQPCWASTCLGLSRQVACRHPHGGQARPNSLITTTRRPRPPSWASFDSFLIGVFCGELQELHGERCNRYKPPWVYGMSYMVSWFSPAPHGFVYLCMQCSSTDVSTLHDFIFSVFTFKFDHYKYIYFNETHCVRLLHALIDQC